VQGDSNPAAAEGVTHPESLRQKDHNDWKTLESAAPVFHDGKPTPKGQRRL